MKKVRIRPEGEEKVKEPLGSSMKKVRIRSEGEEKPLGEIHEENEGKE